MQLSVYISLASYTLVTKFIVSHYIHKIDFMFKWYFVSQAKLIQAGNEITQVDQLLKHNRYDNTNQLKLPHCLVITCNHCGTFINNLL